MKKFTAAPLVYLEPPTTRELLAPFGKLNFEARRFVEGNAEGLIHDRSNITLLLARTI